MTIHQLLILVTVVNEGSFGRAARRLGISQAAVSTQIKALERELGQTVLVRRSGPGRPELTAAGKLAYRTAITVLKALHNLRVGVGRHRPSDFLGGVVRERIEVASDPVPGLYLLPWLAEEFRQRHPTAEVRLLTDTDHRSILDLVRKGLSDLAVVPGNRRTPGCIAECAFSLELVAVSRADHEESQGDRDWLGKLSLVLPRRGTPLREVLDGYFATLGVEPRVAEETSHLEAVAKRVKTGGLAAIVPRVAVEEDLALGTLVELRLPATLPRLEYKLVRARARTREAVRHFCWFVRHKLQESPPARPYIQTILPHAAEPRPRG